MLGLLVVFAVVVLISVLPVMLGARLVGAEKTNFGTALLAVILLGVFGLIVQKLGMGPFLSFAVSAAVGAGVLAFVLGTTFWRGMAVSAITAVVQIGVLMVFAAGALLSILS